jgi:glyoxylase-like metal-dependent hydrolase (beta-lactamase superfamily II)
MPGYKATVGDCEIISLTDVQMQFPWSMFLPNVPIAEIEAYRDLYPETFGQGMFKTDAAAYAVRSGGKTVLVDTGIGPGPVTMLGGIEGKMLSDMKAKGISPEDVDIVVHTHLHFDHVGWNVTDGSPTFPNATYYASQVDADYFWENMQSNPQIAKQVAPLKELGRFKTFSGEFSPAPNLTTIPTPGHTPGHHSVLVSSGGEMAIITGDVAHHPSQVDHPEWATGFDIDATAAAATRKAIVERLEAEGGIAAFCHFPGEGFGRIVRSGNRRVFQAL